MSINYTRINWQDNTNPALSAENLNTMDAGILQCTTNINSLDTRVSDLRNTVSELTLQDINNFKDNTFEIVMDGKDNNNLIIIPSDTSHRYILNTRLVQKRATEAVWNSVPTFVPLAGEFIIYLPDGTNPMKLKIGDGVTQIADLDFFTGQTGPQGIQGIKGDAATITIGTVTTGSAGTKATVTNVGTQYDAKLNFTIPQGIKGDKGDKGDQGIKGIDGINPTIRLGTVTTGEEGSNVVITNTGTNRDMVLNFTIPRGDTGYGINIIGSLTSTNLLPGIGNPGDAYLIHGELWVWSSIDKNWINIGNIKGEKGDTGEKGDRGATGTAATIEVGTVTTGAPGTSVTVTNAGTSSAAKFNFTIPQGAKGATGNKGDKGDTGTGVSSVTQTTTSTASGGTNIITVTLSDGKTSQFSVMNGLRGEQGPKGDPGSDASIVWQDF